MLAKKITVYHPDFENVAMRHAQASLGMFKGDPLCIGHFTDNELDRPKWPHAIFALP
jgi:hypothetical protein